MTAHGPLITPSGDGDRSQPVIIDRKTRGGRTLRYRLTILQQPERARACGSGSKSAADRRPVDPPPVVELRIFEVTGAGGPLDMKDITFLYNANFFIFTSLELARPMAHGRVQTPAATSAPVLTGVPVSGMAYLDRPAEAGYFLFPDLSVRHEGRYKLGFTLYEETKEQCDFDAESSDEKAVEGPAFCCRMEIKSDPFTVFSAKKFPGLTESTTLSRTVAEQGCKVRIRRDVRMRRRDGKAGGDYDKSDGDFTRRQTRTPERQQPHDQYRQRSLSATSEHGRLPYEQPRRPSGAEAYPPPPPGPPVGYPQPSPSSNLNFNQAPQYAPPHYGGSQIAASPTTPTHASSHPSPHQTPQTPYASLSRPPSQHMPPMPASPQQSIKNETPCMPHSHSHSLPSLQSRDTNTATVLPSFASLVSKTRSPTPKLEPAPIGRMAGSTAPVGRALYMHDNKQIEADPNPDRPPIDEAYNSGMKRRYQDESHWHEQMQGRVRPKLDGQEPSPRRGKCLLPRRDYPLYNADGYRCNLASGPFYH